MLNGARAGSLPAKYTGGMTQAGVDNLKAFVQAGGTLVRDQRRDPAADPGVLRLPDDRRHRGRAEHQLLLAGLDPRGPWSTTKTPLTWGMGDTADLYSDGSPAFSVDAPARPA